MVRGQDAINPHDSGVSGPVLVFTAQALSEGSARHRVPLMGDDVLPGGQDRHQGAVSASVSGAGLAGAAQALSDA